MKVRHLRAMGYQVISLPYWELHLKASADQKKMVLQKVLRFVDSSSGACE